MKIPKPIVDKNGKRTTVLINPFKKETGSDRLGSVAIAKALPFGDRNDPEFWDNDYSGRFSERQVKAYFPLARDAKLFGAMPMTGSDNSLIQFTTPKIPVNKNKGLADMLETHVATNLASDFYDTEAVWIQDSKGQSVSLVFTADIPTNHSSSDIAAAYAGVADKLRNVKITAGNSFAAALRSQKSATSKVSGLSVTELAEVAQGDDAEAIRVIPHLDTRTRFSGGVYMDMANNPNTPKATIHAMVREHRTFQPGTEHMAYEAFDTIRANHSLSWSENISLKVTMESLQRQMDKA